MRTDRVEDRWREWLAGRGSLEVPIREEGEEQVPSSSGALRQGRAHAEGEWGRSWHLLRWCCPAIPRCYAAPASLHPQARSPASEQQPPLPTLLGSRAGHQAWAPPGDRHPYSLSPIEEGKVGRRRGGGGGVRGGKDGEGGEVVLEREKRKERRRGGAARERG